MTTKAEVRAAAATARREQPGKDVASRAVIDRLFAIPEYQIARCVMWYVHVRDEVRTTSGIKRAMAFGQKVIVPYCMGDDLKLFCLESISELDLGRFGILEPKAELRNDPCREPSPESIDLIVVPGVGFDSNCNRIGHGKGYYDRCLSSIERETLLVGLAYQRQIIDHIPVEDHDRPMDMVVTERQLYLKQSGSD